MEIKGKVAWVHGGNSGLGLAAAKALLEKGAKVLITARREELGNLIAAELGENCMYIKADSLVYDELKAAADAAVAKWGHLDMLLACAGGGATVMEPFPHPALGIILSEDENVLKESIYDMEYAFKLNLLGTLFCARIAANHMVKNEPGEMGERGSIITVGSIASDKIWFHEDPENPLPPSGLIYGYGATKAGLLGLTRDLSYRLGDFGIRVNMIKPGFFRTEMTQIAQPNLYDSENPDQIFPKRGGDPKYFGQLAIAIFENVFMNRGVYNIDAGYIG